MSECTPTIDEVRDAYAGHDADWAIGAAQFDRWLDGLVDAAQREALVKAASTGLFGTSAQSTLLWLSALNGGRIADLIPGEGFGTSDTARMVERKELKANLDRMVLLMGKIIEKLEGENGTN